MLNPFPELLFLGTILAPLIMRLAAGGVFLALAHRHAAIRSAVRAELPYAKWFSVLLPITEGAIAIALIAGFFTQLAAIAALVVAVKGLLLRKRFSHTYPLTASAYVLLAAISLSLLLTGAGAFAFDLPL